MKIIDLTLEMKDGMSFHPSHPPLQLVEQSTFENSGHRYISPCEGFESRKILMSDHSGTHIDAPLHFIKEGPSASEMNLDRTIGQAVVLDVSPYKKTNEPVSLEMLQKAELKQKVDWSSIQILLLKTTKCVWGTDEYFKTESLAEEVIPWILDKNLKLLGIDLGNIDCDSNMKRSVHLSLLSNDIYIVENLVNLESLLPYEDIVFVGTPLKIRNATGSPIRAFAMVGDAE